MEEAQQLCDRIVVMYQGKILREGVPSRLVEEEIGREVVEIRIAGAAGAPDALKARSNGWWQPWVAGRSGTSEWDTLYFYCRDGKDLMRKAVEMNCRACSIGPPLSRMSSSSSRAGG